MWDEVSSVDDRSVVGPSEVASGEEDKTDGENCVWAFRNQDEKAIRMISITLRPIATGRFA